MGGSEKASLGGCQPARLPPFRITALKNQFGRRRETNKRASSYRPMAFRKERAARPESGLTLITGLAGDLARPASQNAAKGSQASLNQKSLRFKR